MKNELGIFTISEIMTSSKNGQEKDVNLNQFKQKQFENIISKTKEGYNFLIESSFGNIFAKSLIMEKLSPSNIYVRVLNIKEKLIKEKFFAYLYNGKSFIQVLSIDSSSMCCTKGTFMIYLIKKYSKITDDDLKILKIHSCHVITDVSFRINGSL
ncbi:RAB GDP dissociation inhibitor [Nosema bombycis CQ1]|uniref:RAB GDP dissociation inhibitor n=1 Tax=Nosema bombycis (strain CQ1 / CVCC 102059) TaxID=578461 RepID=R0KSE4_NOSB1|nr:RAB GDP dissociation inhibitor [Nosema bombycis CQ1]|eukprot:EOB13691.1 RAB GDP dissociation inhibitor [Nosema bombycis CQ1]